MSNELLHSPFLFASTASRIRSSAIAAAFVRGLNSLALTFSGCLLHLWTVFSSLPSITAQFKSKNKLNWWYNLCLLRPKFYSSNYVILPFLLFLNDTDVPVTAELVVSLYQCDMSNCYLHMPLVVFHIVPFSKRTQVLFVAFIPDCILARFGISLPLLNYFVLSWNCSSGTVIGFPCI